MQYGKLPVIFTRNGRMVGGGLEDLVDIDPIPNLTADTQLAKWPHCSKPERNTRESRVWSGSKAETTKPSIWAKCFWTRNSSQNRF